jgi:ABC-type oligopeptide transport system ATPase subunit
MTTFLIGIAGKTGYGKSTVAKLIKDINGKSEPTIVCSFADVPRTILTKTFPQLSVNDFKDRILKEKHIAALNATPRELLIEFASDFARKRNPDVWVDHAEYLFGQLSKANNAYRQKYNFVIFDDVRFENEVAFIRKYGGSIIHLERPEPKKTIWQRLWEYYTPPHESTIGVRHLFNPKSDWVLNTSAPMGKTIQSVKDMAVHRYDRGFEL